VEELSHTNLFARGQKAKGKLGTVRKQGYGGLGINRGNGSLTGQS